MSFDHSISRRNVFKGAGGLAVASALGAGAALGATTPAHAAGLDVVEHQTYGRMEYYKVSTPSIAWKPRVNVLLPDGYDSGRRYPVLYLLHGGAQNFMKFDKEDDIRGLTAGRDLIVVMPDGGIAGWYCNPVTANLGPRNWETFHIEELIPWVDATFRTFPEQAGRAVSGFSMGGFGALKYNAKYSNYFASVSAHSGPANLRSHNYAVVRWANVSSALVEINGGTIYGAPKPFWHQDLISADNPMENLESYRNKRIFLVSGNNKDIINFQIVGIISSALNEYFVRETQHEFTAALDSAGIKYERYEEQGGHFVRPERLQQDIDGIVAHLRKAE